MFADYLVTLFRNMRMIDFCNYVNAELRPPNACLDNQSTFTFSRFILNQHLLT